MKLWCCSCASEVRARLTNGAEVYPHRRDLAGLPFWMCDNCGNWVGCHHKTKNRRNPLGNIPSPEIKKARSHIHALIDPMWKSRKIKRSDLYRIMSDRLGWNYHTAHIKTLEEAREAYRVGRDIQREIAVKNYEEPT